MMICVTSGEARTHIPPPLAGKLSLKEIRNVQMSFEVITFSEVIGF